MIQKAIQNGKHIILTVIADTKTEAQEFAQQYCNDSYDEEYIVTECKIDLKGTFEVLATDINR